MDKRVEERKPIWYNCLYCKHTKFTHLHDFTRHLRGEHCSVEGGSFVCRYGYNSVCNSLPVEGVSDLDYADHIMKHHAFAAHNAESSRRKQSTSSEKSISSNAEPSAWLAVSASQNLAAVLNDPGRGKQRDLFTKLWGVDFVDTPLANIPPNPNLALVTRATFESYLRKIGKRHRRHEQIKEEAEREVGVRRRGRAADRRLGPLDLPPIFLQQEFDLSKPATFYTTVPFAKSGITVDGPFRENAVMLQEKLSQSLDQVEMRIAEQVADKSEGFFAAMTCHDTLMEQLSKMVALVRVLRSRLANLDMVVANQTLHALRLNQRRANHLLLLQKIQILLSAPDYVAALELIVTSQELVTSRLDSVHCFRHLGPQLMEITRLIDKMMATEFESYSTKDLNRPLGDELDVLEQEKLVCIMLGMLRRGSTAFISQYRDESLTAVRALVKQVVLERLAESDCETHGLFSDRIQALPLPQYLILMDMLTIQLARLLRKIKGVHDVMKDTIDMAAGVKTEPEAAARESEGFSFLASRDLERANSELVKLLTDVCAFAHEECAKLLTNLTLDTATGAQVCRLGQLIERFCKECMDLSGRGPAALRATFQVAASKFVQKFHNERKEQLSTALDSDHWKPVDVPNQCQDVINSLFEGTGFQTSTSDARSQPFLTVGEDKYFIVACAVLLVRLIGEYCVLSRELPSLSWALQRHLLELLTLFNSRSYRLVLDAGAVQTTCLLKTITTTNLVLVSRTLELIVWLLPHIRIHFEALTSEQRNGKNSTSLFDEVEKNMKNHIGLVQEKVAMIVSFVVAGEITRWAAKPPVPSESFRNITKYLTKVHEAVSKVVPADQIEEIYRKINDRFKASLRDRIKQLNILPNGGPLHGAVTSELIFYVDLLRKLKVLSDEQLSENSLAEIWPSKPNS